MKHIFTQEQITAIRNLIVVAEEHYDSKRVVDADDVIVLNSAEELKKVLDKWDKRHHG